MFHIFPKHSAWKTETCISCHRVLQPRKMCKPAGIEQSFFQPEPVLWVLGQSTATNGARDTSSSSFCSYTANIQSSNSFWLVLDMYLATCAFHRWSANWLSKKGNWSTRSKNTTRWSEVADSSEPLRASLCASQNLVQSTIRESECLFFFTCSLCLCTEIRWPSSSWQAIFTLPNIESLTVSNVSCTAFMFLYLTGHKETWIYFTGVLNPKPLVGSKLCLLRTARKGNRRERS